MDGLDHRYDDQKSGKTVDDTTTTTAVQSPLPEMPLLPITSVETVTACGEFAVTDCDIFVCSYPKSGTTWTQNLVVRLLAAHVGMELPQNWHLSHSAPFYEVDQYWNTSASTQLERIPAKVPITRGEAIECCSTYRVFNTHLRRHQLPPTAKCIYVMRDPMDVLVSFYHHMIHMCAEDGGYHGSPLEFAKDFMDGTILYGTWQDHIESWAGQSTDSKTYHQDVLLLHYHEMKIDLRREAIRVVLFLLGDEVGNVERLVDTVLTKCTFDAMREERWRYTPLSVSWNVDAQTGRPYDNFVREGRVGDGRAFVEKYFTEDLQTQWTACQQRAKSRWRIAGVDDSISNMYLKSPSSQVSYVKGSCTRRSFMKCRTSCVTLRPLFLVTVTFFVMILCHGVNSGHATVANPSQTFISPRTLSPKQLTPKDVFVIVTPVENALSFAVSQQLYPATIYWIILGSPGGGDSSEEKKLRSTWKRSKAVSPLMTIFNPYGTPQQTRTSAYKCLQNMEQDLSVRSVEALDSTKDGDNKPFLVRGVLFNQYGFPEDPRKSNEPSLVEVTRLSQYKLISTAIVIDALKKAAGKRTNERLIQPTFGTNGGLLYASDMRIIAVGSEAARGLPKMGFPVPIIGETEQSIQDILAGGKGVATVCQASASSWKQKYAQLNALLVLYFKSLASADDKATMDPACCYWYYGVLSPGMTEESMQLKHVPPEARTVVFRLTLILCRWILFPLLRRLEITKTVQEAGALLASALMNGNEYAVHPNGAFVGAKSGTGGPLCEQTLLEGGMLLRDPSLQRLTHLVVQQYI